MKKRFRKKIPRFNSKRGMSLVELVVGITIIVIVFGATLSAMTNGYSTTIYNAEVNKSAVGGGSLNELLFQSVSKLDFYNEEAAQEYFFGVGNTKDPNSDSENAVHAAALSYDESIKYVSPDEFPLQNVDVQYTVELNSSSKVTDGSNQHTIKGIKVQTYVASSRGSLVNNSFIPYSYQDTVN